MKNITVSAVSTLANGEAAQKDDTKIKLNITCTFRKHDILISEPLSLILILILAIGS